ncbi:MAG: DsbA family protein, partial [Anaerolineales bacterium]
LGPLTERYGDLIQFVYRDYPIFGEESILGALAGECADEQGDYFWDFHDYIFDNQLTAQPEPISLPFLTVLAEDLELDIEEWTTCIQSDEAFEELRNDFTQGQSWGITGTPTFFINGERLVGAQPLEAFISIIDAELIAAGIEPPSE